MSGLTFSKNAQSVKIGKEAKYSLKFFGNTSIQGHTQDKVSSRQWFDPGINEIAIRLLLSIPPLVDY
jgi:hypothetical protein